MAGPLIMSETSLRPILISTLVALVCYSVAEQTTWFDPIKKLFTKKLVDPINESAKPRMFQNVGEDYKPPIINPVDPSFKWEETEPIPYRPFKNGPYKMTMALNTLDVNDWFLLENTYLERTKIKEQLTREYPANTALYTQESIPAVQEYFNICMNFMCDKYPMYFERVQKDGQAMIHNSIRDEYVLADAKNYTDPQDILLALARNTEEDFLILLKEEEEGEYVLKGGVFGFPAGFDPSTKFNLRLTDIHIPVPDYNQKLQLSMNKFFERVMPGQFVMRTNWSMQTHTKLLALKDNHAAADEEIKATDPNKLNFNKVFLRVERQILTRLPESKAVVFTVRTYLTPIRKIRDEGRAVDLCGAIDGLPDKVAQYKRRAEWGDAIKSFLKGECEGILDD